MITPQDALNRLIDQNELFYDEMTDLMRQIMRGEIAPELIAAILIGLRIKVESVSEITAATNVLREFMSRVEVKDEATKAKLVDIVGTGGDNAKTFNISSTSMFVAAAGGAKVAKHGGRSVSSNSGAADVMEQIGARIDLTPEMVAQCIEKIGIGFMFAQAHHKAMKYVAPVRKTLGVRTFFNILGPLSNPADAPNQVLGVFHPDLVGICARVNQQRGMSRVLVVNGRDGLDEITITNATLVGELRDGQIKTYEICPEDFGLQRIDTLKPIQVASSIESAKLMDSVLNKEKGPHRDIVLMNAAATLYCGSVVDSLKDGVKLAAEMIDSGKALEKRTEFIKLTQELAPKA